MDWAKARQLIVRRSHGLRLARRVKVLAESEALMGSIVETVVDGVVTTDATGVIVFINAAALRIFGLTRDEALGASVSLLMPEPDRSAHRAHLERYLRSRDAHVIGIGREVLAQHKDGSVFPVRLAVSEVKVQGQLYFTGILKDITSRVRAEQERERALAHLAEAQALGRSGHWFYDRASKMLELSKECARILGLPSMSRLTDMPTCVSEADRAQLFEALETCLHSGEPFDLDVRASGGRALRILGREYLSESGPAILGVVQDVTEDRRLREELKEARVRAEEANKAKEVFLSTVSHELRTPLTAIVGFSELMLESGELGATNLEYSKRIRAAGHYQLRLVGDLLDIESARRAELRVATQPTSLQSVVESAVGVVTPLASNAHIRFQQDIGKDLPAVQVDAGRIEQVLVNLLANAVRHAPEGGEVSIKAWVEGKQVHLSVSDTGRGIPSEELARIFEPFERGEGSARWPGLGVGLPLAKRLVELHHGELHLQSQVGVGTTARVSLPLAMGEGAS